MAKRALLSCSLLFVVCFPAAPLHPDSADSRFLLNGVEEIAAPGVPGPLCIFGDRAFVVATANVSGACQAPVVAAARLGRGRVAAFGHGGYFGRGSLDTADTGRLVVNTVRWVAGKKKPAAIRVALFHQGGLLAYLKEMGFEAEALAGRPSRESLEPFDAVCFFPTSLSGKAEIDAVREYVRGGGGLLVADLGWGWLQLNPGKSLVADHQGNLLLAPAGVVWADGYLQRNSEAGYRLGRERLDLTHAARALGAAKAVEGGRKELDAGALSQVSWILSHAVRSIPPEDELLLPRLRRVCARGAAGDSSKAELSFPLARNKPLARLALTMQLAELKKKAPEEVTASPAAARFPGAVPENAVPVKRSLKIDTSIPDRHGTGLYAPPGSIVTVSLPPGAEGQGLRLRIGAHSDSLWHHATWNRAPEICRVVALEERTTRAASAFGGLVYIEVPHRCRLGGIDLIVEGAVEAPRYILDETDLESWRSSIRHLPGPWAELETKKVILTLPSKEVRGLDDPKGVMEFWDQVMDCCADLAARPRERSRPERYVTDIQISAGYMHAGYPIMTHLDIAPVMVDVPRMKANGHGGVWGLFHEMGHNHQHGDWTFGGTGEVTCNLFTLYVFEKACGMPISAHGSFTDQAMAETMKKHIAAGADFGKWKGSPFLALVMYVQLRQAFGWEAFQTVFAEYRNRASGERPKSDSEKRDQWMVRFSRQVGRNLGPFFQGWGVPTSESARQSIAGLPGWLPDDFPVKEKKIESSAK